MTPVKHINLTEAQKRKLTELWFIYGNNGKKHSDRNHKYIQQYLEQGVNLSVFYKPSEECMKKVEEIINAT